MRPLFHMRLLLLCSVQLIWAQSEFSSPWRFGGNTIMESYWYTQKADAQEATQNEWKTNLDLDYRLGSAITFKSSTQVNLNTFVSKRNFIEPRELFVTFRTKKFKISLGKQIIDWSKLTGWSSADIPNTYQYYDFLDTDDEERGHWSLKGNFQQNKFQIDITAIPVYKVSKLFFENNRWTSSPLTFADIESIDTYDEVQLGMELSVGLGNTRQVLLAYHGYNDIPARRLAVSGQNSNNGPEYTLQLLYHKLQYIGWQGEFFMGRWNFWTEATAIRSRILENNSLRPHVFYNLIVGIDRTFDFADPEQQLKLLAQYIYSFNTEGVEYGPTDLDHIFNKAFLAHIEYRLNYNVEWELRAALELQEKGYYLNPMLELRVLKDLKFFAGADILFGSKTGFFGNYDTNTRLRFALSYIF